MKHIISLIILITFISCGVNSKVVRAENIQKTASENILNKYSNVIILNYEISTVSNLIYTDKNGDWKLLKISNGRKKSIALNKEPHFVSDSIVVETEDEIKKVNSKTNFIGDKSTISFNYKYPDETYRFHFNGKIDDFRKLTFELNYLNIINEIILEEKL